MRLCVSRANARDERCWQVRRRELRGKEPMERVPHLPDLERSCPAAAAPQAAKESTEEDLL